MTARARHAILPRVSTASALCIALILAVLPWGSPPLALACGILLAALVDPREPKSLSRTTRVVLQSSVVGLGFGVELGKVLQVTGEGLVLAMLTICGTLALGFLLARMLRLESRISYLISCGTAICGGSAIAAVAPVIEAKDEETAIALGTVFTLNAIALFLFPVIGVYFAMSQGEFGLWAAIAIHDTSSVVGAASRFGDDALQIATTVKLGRALFIVPLTLFTAFIFGRRAGWSAVPPFIGLFFGAVVLRSVVPSAPFWEPIAFVAKRGLIAALFLIGAGFSPRRLLAVGPRALLLGAILWLAISAFTFCMVSV